MRKQNSLEVPPSFLCQVPGRLQASLSSQSPEKPPPAPALLPIPRTAASPAPGREGQGPPAHNGSTFLIPVVKTEATSGDCPLRGLLNCLNELPEAQDSHSSAAGGPQLPEEPGAWRRNLRGRPLWTSFPAHHFPTGRPWSINSPRESREDGWGGSLAGLCS